jgi:hypothetical protein
LGIYSELNTYADIILPVPLFMITSDGKIIEAPRDNIGGMTVPAPYVNILNHDGFYNADGQYHDGYHDWMETMSGYSSGSSTAAFFFHSSILWNRIRDFRATNTPAP